MGKKWESSDQTKDAGRKRFDGKVGKKWEEEGKERKGKERKGKGKVSRLVEE